MSLVVLDTVTSNERKYCQFIKYSKEGARIRKVPSEKRPFQKNLDFHRYWINSQTVYLEWVSKNTFCRWTQVLSCMLKLRATAEHPSTSCAAKYQTHCMEISSRCKKLRFLDLLLCNIHLSPTPLPQFSDYSTVYSHNRMWPSSFLQLFPLTLKKG